MKRSFYLKSTDIEIAKSLYEKSLESIFLSIKTERVETKDAYNRVLAQAVYAKRSVPFYPSAAMDGIAINSRLTIGANEHKPLLLNNNDYIEVDTGDPILEPYDAVIMVEDCIESEKGIQIIKSVVPWENVRPIGEDIVEGELLFPMEHVLRPMDISVLMAANLLTIEVYKQVKVAIIPTGTEIRSAYDKVETGDIVESNSYLFMGLSKEAYAIPTTLDIVPDDYDQLKETIKKASSMYDVVLVNAGSSAGREDYTASVISDLGEVIVHGLAIKPGKPAILGIVNHVPVIGIPGYPVSAHIVFEEFVTPLLLKMNHRPRLIQKTVQATSTRRIVSSLKSKEYIRVKLGYIDGKFVATPLARGAGMMMSVVKSDGYALIEKISEGIEANEEMTVWLNKPLEIIQNTIMAIGSHDVIMDVLNNLFEQSKVNYHISSVHVGSYAGLLALKRKESHIAMTHLLDSTGTYNHEVVKQLFSNESMVLIKGVKRIQGLIVQPGNPLNILTIQDIVNHRFVNRQRGAGTRVLLDYWLKKYDINPEAINGYEKELSTHLAVAAAVQSGIADCGLGVYSAAKIMGCDFIPLGEEDYDFICRKEFLENDMMKQFLISLKSDSFKQICTQLGGYNTSCSGEVYLYERSV
jgi:putative molybdopterin biosynthesis protein